MKKSYLVIILLSTFAMTACGSSSGGSTAVQLANNAIAALDNITDNWTCTDTTFTTCECPGGGNVVFSGIIDTTASTAKATQTATANNCTDLDSGLSFEGTMIVDDATSEAALDFSTFGDCSNFVGTLDVSGDTCTGTTTGTCGGQALTCNWTASGDECICGS